MRLVAVGILAVVLITSIPFVYHSSPPTEDVSTSGTYNITYTENEKFYYDISFRVDRHPRQEVFVSFADIGEFEMQCLEKNDGNNNYRVEDNCNNVRIHGYIDSEEWLRNEDNLGYQGRGTLIIQRLELAWHQPSGWEYQNLYRTLEKNESNVQVQSPAVYTGKIERLHLESNQDTVVVVAPKSSDEYTDNQSLKRLLDSHDKIPINDNSETIPVFILPSESDPSVWYANQPSGRGIHLGIGNTIVIRENAPLGVLTHEYVHTQQEYSATKRLKWLREGQATHYGNIVMHDSGFITTAQLKDRYDIPDAHRKVMLAKKSSWVGASKYTKGQLTVTSFKAYLRQASATDEEIRDIFRRINQHEGRVSYRDIEFIVVTETGVNPRLWMQMYISETRTAPSPAMYEN